MSAEGQGELLSALMDGELSELELRRLLATLDMNQAQQWARWHLAQDALHGGKNACVVEADFCTRVHAAILAEAAPAPSHWKQSIARVAVAASVALAVVGGWQLWQQQGADPLVSAGLANNSHTPVTGRVAAVGEDFQATLPSTVYSPQAFMGSVRVQPVADTFTIRRDDYNRLMIERQAQATAQHEAAAQPRFVYPLRADSQVER